MRLRYHSRAVPCRVPAPPTGAARSSSSSTNRSTAPRPVSPPAFCAATWSWVGDDHKMTHEQMLQALQDDVDDWPAAVKAAGVKIASGSAYHPVARNNEVLRTPDDPQATYDYMVRAWQAE